MYFRCRNIKLSQKEEIELKQIYKGLLLIKIGLSNFLRLILYTRKSALEIRLMAPQTIISILKLKLYVGNK